MKSFVLASSLLFILPHGLASNIKVSSNAMWPTYPKGALVSSRKISSLNSIKRGDIVLYQNRLDDKWLIDKRVMALPGDTIEIKNKLVFVNGNPLKREKLSKPESTKLNDRLPENLVGAAYQYFRETNDKVSYIIGIISSETQFTNFAKIKIPAGMFFLIGDNRDASKDSRSDGPVQFNKIQGILAP